MSFFGFGVGNGNQPTPRNGSVGVRGSVLGDDDLRSSAGRSANNQDILRSNRSFGGSGGAKDLEGRLSRKSSFDEENQQGDGGILPQTTRPQLQPYTPYDKFLFVIAVAAPFLILVFGELNRAQAWVFMNRWLVRDMDNQWQYNTWDVINQSNATLYNIVGQMAGVAGIYPAISAESLSKAPFITLSQFELYGQEVRQNGSVLFFAYSPYILDDTQRLQWQNYSVDSQGWIEQSFSYTDEVYTPQPIREEIWSYNSKGLPTPVPPDAQPYVPSWQSSPPPTQPDNIVNQDFSSTSTYSRMVDWIDGGYTPILSEPVDVDTIYGTGVVPNADTVVGTTSILMLPVYGELSLNPTNVVAFVSGVVPWSVFFENILPTKIVGFQIVVESCGSDGTNNTFELNGAEVTFVGEGDLHDPEYDQWVVVSPFADFGVSPANNDNNFCTHTLYMFRTDEWSQLFTVAQKETLVLTVCIICSFVLIAIGFAVYEYFLRLRFKNRFNIAIDKFYDESGGTVMIQSLDTNGTGDLKRDDALNKLSRGANLAEFSGRVYPETTVLFADIVGFSEWSSVREPNQVFTLLEAIFGAFDALAERNEVFKVDTFGDSYVAVCGAPVPNKNHPLIMCQFARECLQRAKDVFRELTPQLGPDTSDLAMRFGLNSGPVTASVIQSDPRDSPRLQLFGDAVNTASYIKTTGARNMIHLSEQTANLIIASGRRNLVVERRDRRGVMRTYWLLTLDTDRGPTTTSANFDAEESTDGFEVYDARQSSFVESARAIRESRNDFDPRGVAPRDFSPRGNDLVPRKLDIGDTRSSRENKILRLVQYNSETLVELLKQVVGSRQGSQRRRSSQSSLLSAARNIGNGIIVIEEAVDVISFPESDPRLARTRNGSFRSAQLSPEVIEQVYSFVAVIAGLYRDNAFHNFEHASHVTQSLSKMLARVEASRIDDGIGDNVDRQVRNSDFAYSIAADPLTKFAMVMTTLIHDVDHRGVPNYILDTEEPTLSAAYQGRSVHEQNALELAWNVLLSEGFEDLRACIFTDLNELKLFRQVLVNCVIATDVFDPELRALRKDRYNRAYTGGFRDSVNDVNRRATIAIEHLVQAADLAPTMQPWFLFTKWNEKLYQEAYESYRSGRTNRDPSISWYQDEIDFFDKYSIPLAKKLNNCGVFGVAGDEYLNFAEENRRKWVSRGQEIVALYVENYGRN